MHSLEPAQVPGPALFTPINFASATSIDGTTNGAGTVQRITIKSQKDLMQMSIIAHGVRQTEVTSEASNLVDEQGGYYERKILT